MSRFSILDGHRYIALTTFRRDGQPVITPLAYAQADDIIYAMLPAGAPEVSRIHENAQVEVAPCSDDGTPLAQPVEAMAMVLPDGKIETARHALNARLGFQARLLAVSLALRREHIAYLEITPM